MNWLRTGDYIATNRRLISCRLQVTGRGFLDSPSLRCRTSVDDESSVAVYVDSATIKCLLDTPPDVASPSAGAELAVQAERIAAEKPPRNRRD